MRRRHFPSVAERLLAVLGHVLSILGMLDVLWNEAPTDCADVRLSSEEGIVSAGLVSSRPDLLGHDPDRTEEEIVFNEQLRAAGNRYHVLCVSLIDHFVRNSYRS